MGTLNSYVSTKIVKAEPMDYGHFVMLDKKEISDRHNRDDPGYMVYYPDGYRSWCPKAEFERTNRPISITEAALIK